MRLPSYRIALAVGEPHVRGVGGEARFGREHFPQLMHGLTQIRASGVVRASPGMRGSAAAGHPPAS